MRQATVSLFPFDAVREGQRAFLEDAREALAGGKVLLAQAPTGMGKTAVGLAAALEVARAEDLTVFFLTSKQSQHRMAVDTARRIRDRGAAVRCVDVIAKQAMCLQSDAPGHPAAFQGFCEALVRRQACVFYRRESQAVATQLARAVLHVQEMETVCRQHGVCPHKAALEAARETELLVCDYNYLFSEMREGILAKMGLRPGRVLAVIDEAHNLPDRVRSQVSSDLTPSMLERAKREAMRVDRRVARTLSRFAAGLRTALGPLGEQEVPPEFLGEVLEASCPGESVMELATVLEILGEELAGTGGGGAVFHVASFLQGWRARGGMARIARGGESMRLSYRLLDPAVLAGKVFASLGGAVLMSGTLHPVTMYADLLGIPAERRVVKIYPSPFDPANRLLLCTREHTSAYARRGPAMYRQIAATVASACEVLPGNAALFLPSYEFTARVAEALRHCLTRAMLVENQAWTKEDRDAALRWLEEHADPGGLLVGVVGGGLSEGVDYRDNLLKAVFIVGLPLSPPTVESKALERYMVGKFGAERGHEYAVLYPAVNKILQAAGRSIRGETDRAVIVLMESRLLEERFRRLFPEGFDYGLVPDLVTAVSSFFTPSPDSRMTAASSNNLT